MNIVYLEKCLCHLKVAIDDINTQEMDYHSTDLICGNSIILIQNVVYQGYTQPVCIVRNACNF